MTNRLLDVLKHKRRSRMAVAMGLALGLGVGVTLAAPSPTRTGPAAAQVLVRGQNSGDGLLPTVAHAPGINTQPARSTAATIVVTNCNNSGNGSLRAAISAANSGDTVDISGLACTIELNSSIITSVDDLTIKGNPDNQYGISGKNAVRPIRVATAGTSILLLDGVTVAYGLAESNSSTPARGGCIYSSGAVRLQNRSVVQHCSAKHKATTANGGGAQGGAIFAPGIEVVNSMVRDSAAIGVANPAYGGGIYATGRITLFNAVISGNHASVGSAPMAAGGGVFTRSSLNVTRSSIVDNSATNSGNTAAALGGGVWARTIPGSFTFFDYSTIADNSAAAGSAMVLSGDPGHPARIVNSTIADNDSTSTTSASSGAVLLRGPTTIRNSTISGNTEQNNLAQKYGAGVTIDNGVAVSMYSTVVSRNVMLEGGLEYASDLFGDPTSPASVSGDHNLRGYASSVSMPPDTIYDTTPDLGPLADHGGLTRTMAVLPGSPLIDAGDDDDGNGGSFLHDQRGSGFTRVYGASADIGAFELNNDIIFVNGFN